MIKFLLRLLTRVAALTMAAIGLWIAYSKLFIRHNIRIGNAVDAERKTFTGARSTPLSYYVDDEPATGKPLVLIHSVNAAASSYEMRPIFEHYRGQRPVYALDLPGFGFSERADRVYSPELYTNAILDFMEQIVQQPADVIALSLGSEFVARAAHEAPQLFDSVTLISPTGLSMARAGRNLPEDNSSDTFFEFVSNPLWSQPFFDLLTSRLSIRLFLSQSFVGKVDGSLIEYSWRSSHQEGGRYAPLHFISGKLFTRTIFDDVYTKLQSPVLVLYDEDAYTDFDRLTEILSANTNWRARRVPRTRGLPQFERLDKVIELLNHFWEDLSS